MTTKAAFKKSAGRTWAHIHMYMIYSALGPFSPSKWNQFTNPRLPESGHASAQVGLG